VGGGSKGLEVKALWAGKGPGLGRSAGILVWMSNIHIFSLTLWRNSKRLKKLPRLCSRVGSETFFAACHAMPCLLGRGQPCHGCVCFSPVSQHIKILNSQQESKSTLCGCYLVIYSWKVIGMCFSNFINYLILNIGHNSNLGEPMYSISRIYKHACLMRFGICLCCIGDFLVRHTFHYAHLIGRSWRIWKTNKIAPTYLEGAQP
jgi:hypothetical protein